MERTQIPNTASKRDASAAATTGRMVDIRVQLQQLADHMRESVHTVDDPRAEALLETSAEVLLGLKQAYIDFGEKSEPAWHADTLTGDGDTPAVAPRAADRHAIDDEYNVHDASFRRHYQLNLHDSGHDFGYYAPAYRFGYELATENPHEEWESLHANAQRHWQTAHTTDWVEMAPAVEYGWEEARNPEELRVQH